MPTPYNPEQEPLADYNALDTRVLVSLNVNPELPIDSEDPLFIPQNLATMATRRLVKGQLIDATHLLTPTGEEYLKRHQESFAKYPDVKSAMGLYKPPSRLGVLDYVAEHRELAAPTRREAAELVLVEADLDISLAGKLEQVIGGLVVADLLSEDQDETGIVLTPTIGTDHRLEAVSYFFPGRPHGAELLSQHFANYLESTKGTESLEPRR